MSTTTDSTVSAGSEQHLYCSVQEIPNLVVEPKLMWLSPNNQVIASRHGLSLSTVLNTVGTRDAGQYTCQVTVTVESVGVSAVGENSTTLKVLSEVLYDDY